MKEGGWRDIIYSKHPNMLFRQLFSWGRGKEFLDEMAKRTPSLKSFFSCIDIFESCLSFIIQDKVLDEINDFSSKLATNPSFAEIVRDILTDFLCRLVEETQERPGWVTQTFGIDLWSLYERLESFLYAETQFFKFVLPMANFECEGHPFGIEIDDNLKIIDAWQVRREMERVPDVFKQTLIMQQVFPPLYALEVAFETEKWGNLGTPENKLVLTNSQVYTFNINADFISGGRGIIVGNVGRLPIELESLLYRVITALRLLKSGDVGFTTLYVISPPPMSRWMAINPPTFTLPPRQFTRARRLYTLAPNEIEQIKELIRFLSLMYTRRKFLREMGLAVRRYNYSYQREGMEDRLIDYVIVLESLLLQPELELKYRLSLRTSVLLSKGDEEKANEIFQFIKQAYDLRSNIVHGKNITKTLNRIGMPLEEFVSKLEGYARDSIREMFIKHQQYRSKEKILNLLDEMIVKPSARENR